MNFASASSQYATLATGVVSTANDFTISVWVKMNSFATWARVFDFGTGTTNYMFLTAQGPAGAGKPRFAIRTPSVTEQDLDSSVHDFRLNSHAFTATQIAASASPSPRVPTGLSANPSDSLITLNWAVSETATTYNVKRATVSGGPYITVGTGLATPSFVDT